MSEIERKFLIDNFPNNLNFESKNEIEQYYIVNSKDLTIRLRRYNNKYFITFKSGSLMVREEKEIEIKQQDFEELKNIAPKNKIIKTRFIFFDRQYKVELDIFKDELEGLIIAEIEFKTEQEAINYNPPNWFGKEVTQDYKFTNSYLSTHKHFEK